MHPTAFKASIPFKSASCYQCDSLKCLTICKLGWKKGHSTYLTVYWGKEKVIEDNVEYSRSTNLVNQTEDKVKTFVMRETCSQSFLIYFYSPRLIIMQFQNSIIL